MIVLTAIFVSHKVSRRRMMSTSIEEVKLCLLGDAGVGKSSIVHRFVYDAFKPTIESTIGAAFLTKSVTLDSTTYKYQIWDTAGQEKYRALAPMYYRGAAAAIIVYDITVEHSFAAVKMWVRDLKQYAEPDIILAITGNKCDLEELREVQFKDAMAFAEMQNAIFVETSAKTAVNIAALFVEISKQFAVRREQRGTSLDSTASGTINPRDHENAKTGNSKRSCC